MTSTQHFDDMKKVFFLIYILLFILLVVVLYHYFFERTPNRIIKQVFDINLKEDNYKTKLFREQWDLNGDGYCLIVLSNIELEDIHISGEIKELPLDLEQLPPSEISNGQMIPKTGVYQIKFQPSDGRSFDLFIYDSKKKEALFYYQIL